MHVTADFLVYLVIVDLFLPACALGSQSEVKGYIQSAPSVQDTLDCTGQITLKLPSACGLFLLR